MDDNASDSRRGQLNPQDVWKFILAVVALVAILKELRQPPADRTWHGKVGFIPYELRKPTLERARETYWNPDGPILSTKLWGAGWALNLGALKRLAGR
jgi:hypothetical protein